MRNQLSEIDSGILTYKYAGYLLQVKYQINLEELILEADKCEKFDKIILYVNENIVFQSEVNEQYIGRIVNMLKSRWLRAVKNYCKASKIHSSGDMRLGRGRGKVRKTDECVEICRNQANRDRKNPCEWRGNAICKGF